MARHRCRPSPTGYPLTGLAPSGRFAGSGGGTTTPAPAVTPAAATLGNAATQQFTATNFTGGSVTWSASGGGGGTVNGSGLFTAGSNPIDVTVTATGVANPAQTATAVAHVYGLTPSNTSVDISTTQQFTAANFTGGSVTWTAARGTITVGGLYTAPATVGSGSDTVTATGVATPAQVATASVTVTSPVILFSNFTAVANGADLTTDTAVTWTKGTGAFAYSGTMVADSAHAVYCNSIGSAQLAWYVAKGNVPPSPDYTVTATYTFLSAGQAAIFARSGDPSAGVGNGYAVDTRGFAGVRLIRLDAGVVTVLATLNASDPTGNFTLELKVTGTSIKGTVSGSLSGTATVTDATYAAAGYVGIGCVNFANTAVTGPHCSSVTAQ